MTTWQEIKNTLIDIIERCMGHQSIKLKKKKRVNKDVSELIEKK